jgi:hypothetical protein
MNLAQISSGHDALDCYDRGVSLMLQEKGRLGEAVDYVVYKYSPLTTQALNRKLSNGLAAMAELFMTDLWSHSVKSPNPQVSSLARSKNVRGCWKSRGRIAPKTPRHFFNLQICECVKGETTKPRPCCIELSC